jgi:hypothetical protein
MRTSNVLLWAESLPPPSRLSLFYQLLGSFTSFGSLGVIGPIPLVPYAA